MFLFAKVKTYRGINMAKILVLYGSPRLNGNSEALGDSFVEGAKENHNEITSFHVANMNIHGCLGCYKGGKDPLHPCVIKDDMDKIYPHLVDADIFVFVSPMYYWSFSSQMKAVIDRSMAIGEAGSHGLDHKKAIVLMSSEDEGEKNFAPVMGMIKEWFSYYKWDPLGIINMGGVLQSNDHLGRKELKEAYELGKSIK
jgi:multimeric flavodoxin WrbA